MAEPAVHFSVAFSALSAVGCDPITSFAASVVAVIPDFDVLFGVHRSVSHSILLHLPIALAGLLLRAADLHCSDLLLAIWLSLLTHALLDVLTGFSPILWPMVKDEIYVRAMIGATFQHSVELKPVFSVRSRPMDAAEFKSLDATALTAEGVVISILLFGLSLLMFLTQG